MSLPQIMVVAGEASGDQHAAGVVCELKLRFPGVRFFGMGGERMAAAGVELLFGADEISVMGVTEVLPKLRRILQVEKGLLRAAKRRQPLCALLVDVPDFNLRVARGLKALGVPVAYYVSPMVWAWRKGRVATIAERVDRMICILPFEEPFYRKAGVITRYVGNPVLEQVPAAASPAEFRSRLGLAVDRPTMALLPGSRRSELARILPTLVEASKLLAARKPGLQVVIPVAPQLPFEGVSSAFEGSGVRPVLIRGRAPEVVGASDVAVVASGTATLEAGLMERPLVVVYRLSALNYLLGRMLVKVDHISLVNLIFGERLVPELLQGEMTPAGIEREVLKLWEPGPERARVIAGLKSLKEKLGGIGASARAAAEVAQLLR